MPRGLISSTAKAISTPEIVSEFLGHLTPTVEQARRAYLISGDSDISSRELAEAVSETRLSQRTLVSVAQASRFLCGLALDALWANLGTLRPVDSLLEGSGLQPGTSVIDEQTLARFDIYARKIKFLITSADELSPILWRRLSSLRQRQGPLFPRLRSLEMDNISCIEAECASAVLGPSITRLSLACDADIVDVPYHLDDFYYVSQMTKTMVNFSPNVKSLFLGLPPLQKPDPPVLLPLATLPNLKYLSLGSMLVDSVVLDELSKMKTLRKLECAVSYAEEPDGPVSTSSGFESLTSLRIIGSPVDLTAFIDDLGGHQCVASVS
ncbi:hypothetical protein BD413DRAFT_615811 [Trametes elegans]|nr:hypothetical protein BD413DRAFT_615811 [Trametes elegans]